MRLEFSPEAQAEFSDGESYYERQVPGLGARFRADVRDALKRLSHWPLAAPVERGQIRSMVLSRFPYKLLYAVESDQIYIIAVAHLHRAPDY
jgi:plasmid stabilization system protein ParE